MAQRADRGREALPWRLPHGPGSYVLLLEVPERVAASHPTGSRLPRRRIEIGALGELALEAGRYAYVGSALGPGGLAGRLHHHLRPESRGGGRPHWHVDHLRRHARVAEIWLAEGGRRREHAWAGLLARHPRARIPLPRFGASDCRCSAHLLHFARGPGYAWFRRRAGDPALRRIASAAQSCSSP